MSTEIDIKGGGQLGNRQKTPENDYFLKHRGVLL